MRVIAPEDLKDDDMSSMTAFWGAPIVCIEKITTGNEIITAFNTLQNYQTAIGKPITVVQPAEIGGMNSIGPIYTAAQLGMPILDCDGMGRAYPELQMITYHINGLSSTPLAVADEKGNSFICFQVEHNKTKNSEDWIRSTVVNYGCFFGLTVNPQTKQQVLDFAVPNSISRSWRLGKAVLEARKMKIDPMIAL